MICTPMNFDGPWKSYPRVVEFLEKFKDPCKLYKMSLEYLDELHPLLLEELLKHIIVVENKAELFNSLDDARSLF